MKFKVGDYVVALPEADQMYRITTTKAGPMRIVEIRGSQIRLEVGLDFYPSVLAEHFKLAEYAKTELYKALNGVEDEI